MTRPPVPASPPASAARSRRRLALGLAIALAWIAMTVVLLERELGGTRIDGAAPAASTAREPSSVRYALVTLGPSTAGARVGEVAVHTAPEARHGADGVTTRIESSMALELMGRSTALEVEGSIWRATETVPHETPRADVALDMISNGSPLRLEGQVLDDVFRGRVTSAGEELPLELPVPGDLLLAGAFGQALSFPELEPGDDVRIASLDPLTLQPGTARVRCLAIEPFTLGDRQIEARKLEVTTRGFTSTAWVDADGEVLRATTPLGLEIERLETVETAPREMPGTARDMPGTDDLLDLTAIRPSGETPRREATRLVVNVGGVDVETIPEDAWQRRVDGPGGTTLRIHAGTLRAGSPPRADDLTADPFVQSDHPRIVEAARSIAAGVDLETSDPATRSRALALAVHDWVFTRLDKEPVVSIPSALEVLESRRGDCNEHTVLYAALARALELPTRIAVGLVWSDELGGFYYHAWPEVHVGDGWLRLDPTLGQATADATHIKLLEGGIGAWPRLLPFLGALELDVLEVEMEGEMGEST